MTTVAYSVFQLEILPQVPECPEVMVLNATRNSCVEFCTTTMYWQATVEDVTLLTSELPYALDSSAPSGAGVIQPLSIHLSTGQPLGPTTMDELDNKVYDWRNNTGTPQNYYQPNPTMLELYPHMAGTDTVTLTMRLAFIPLRDSTTVDKILYNYFLEEIAAGALTRLMAVPNKPWSNPDGARYYREFFNNAMTVAAIEAAKSYGRTSSQVQMRGQG